MSIPPRDFKRPEEGPISRDRCQSDMCFMTQLGLKCEIRTEIWKTKEVL